jgi:hypothetical protein
MKPQPMPRTAEFLKAKLALSVASFAIGGPALVFAVVGWSQTLGGFGRYVCIFGSLGAMLSGASLLKDIIPRKTVLQPVKAPALEFLVGMEYEEELKN